MKTKGVLILTITTIISVFVFTVTASVFAEPSDPKGKKLDLIKKLDQDNDGRISKEEYLSTHTERFDRLDKNKDGYIDKSEAAKKRKMKALIKRFDKDNDQKVSREEFPGPDEKFNSMDENKDGYIDKSEAMKGRKGPGKDN